VSPSLKYSFSALPLTLTKGSTTMARARTGLTSRRDGSFSAARAPAPSASAAATTAHARRRDGRIVRTGADGMPSARSSSARTAMSAVSTSAASRGRLVGSFSSIRPTSDPSAPLPGTASTGAFLAERTPFPRAPGNGSSRASIWKSITPSEYTSVLSSSGAPRHCSGAM